MTYHLERPLIVTTCSKAENHHAPAMMRTMVFLLVTNKVQIILLMMLLPFETTDEKDSRHPLSENLMTNEKFTSAKSVCRNIYQFQQE